MSLHAYIDNMGATHCGFHADETMELITQHQVRDLEVDLGAMLLQDEAFQSWGMGPVVVQLLELASGVYCEDCGRRLYKGADRRARERKG